MTTNSQPTGVSTFASRTSPSTDQSLQKSFHLSHPRTKKNYFLKFPSLLKFLKPLTTANTNRPNLNLTTTPKLTIYKDFTTTTDRRPAYNITYTQAGVSCFVGQKSAIFEVQFFVGSSLVKIPACV